MIVGCVLWVRLDVDDRVRLHRRNQSGTSSRPPGGLPERLDNDGPLLRSLGIGRGVHTLPARHRTQRARPYDDNRLANINQSCWRRSSLSSVAIPSSMAGRLEFLQPQVRPSVRPPSHRSLCCVSSSPSCALLYIPFVHLLMFTVGPVDFLSLCSHNTLAKLHLFPPRCTHEIPDFSSSFGLDLLCQKRSWSRSLSLSGATAFSSGACHSVHRSPLISIMTLRRRVVSSQTFFLLISYEFYLFPFFLSLFLVLLFFLLCLHCCCDYKQNK